MICFFFVEETFDHVLGANEIDHVSLMCISEHESMQIWDAKWMFDVCSFITQISFLVILEIYLTASVIRSKLKLIANIDFVVTLAPIVNIKVML